MKESLPPSSSPFIRSFFSLFAVGVLSCILLSSSNTVEAQPAPLESDLSFPDAQNPAPVNVLEIDGGYKFNFRAGSNNDRYYKVTYRGKLIREAGTPFKFLSGLNETDLTKAASEIAKGDRNGLKLSLENGATNLGGTLFEALGAKPLTFRGLERFNLRGTAFAGYDTQTDNLQLAIGLETPPYRLPGFQNSQATNWLVFGVEGQHQENTDSTLADGNSGLVTYRSFLGKAYGWRRSADYVETARKITDSFLKVAPTYQKAKEVAVSIRAIPANKRIKLQQLFIDAVDEADPNPTDDNWKRAVREIVEGDTEAVQEQPTFSVYAESSGWYAFAGQTTGGRLKNLLVGSVDYWFMPRRDDVFLRLRYENGYERAAPTTRKNHLMVSLAYRF